MRLSVLKYKEIEGGWCQRIIFFTTVLLIIRELQSLLFSKTVNWDANNVADEVIFGNEI